MGARCCAGAASRAAGALGSLSGHAVGWALSVPFAALVGIAVGSDAVRVPVFQDIQATAALRRSRQSARQQYAATLALSSRLSMHWRSATAWVPSAAATLCTMLHPQVRTPAQGFLQVDLEDLDTSGRNQRAVTHFDYRAEVRRLDVFTEDHVQLDVALVSLAEPRRDCPTLVVNLANAERYDSSLADAVRWSERHGVQVLLWNGRGIGESSGSEGNTSDEIADSKAVLRYAASHFAQLHAYGRSLGGAVLLTSLAELVDSGELAPERFSTAIADNSFRDVPTVAACLVAAKPGRQRWIRNAFDAVLMALDMNPLDAGGALQRTQMAANVVLGSVDDDAMIRDDAVLSRSPNGANHVVRHRSSAGGHCNFLSGRVDFDEWLRDIAALTRP